MTPGGLLLLGLAAWGLRSYGLDRADRIALAVGGIGLALGALAVLLVVGTAVGMRLALRNGHGAGSLSRWGWKRGGAIRSGPIAFVREGGWGGSRLPP